MNRLRTFALALLCVSIALSQNVTRTPRKVRVAQKPTCSPRAICFSGEVSAGEAFRKAINAELDFVLEPAWTITISPKRPDGDCREFVSVVNGPYSAHRVLYIDTSYGWTAEDEVSTSPREFVFVTNCADYRVESDRLGITLGSSPATQEEYDRTLARLGTLARGKGRLWIIDSKISHADDTPDNKLGAIEWMKFAVEISLPPSK